MQSLSIEEWTLREGLSEPGWKGNREYLLAQLVRLVERFLASDRIVLQPESFNRDPLKRRVLLTLHMNRIVQHLWEAIRFQNAESLEPQFDRSKPIRSTSDMPTCYTGKPCHPTRKKRRIGTNRKATARHKPGSRPNDSAAKPRYSDSQIYLWRECVKNKEIVVQSQKQYASRHTSFPSLSPAAFTAGAAPNVTRPKDMSAASMPHIRQQTKDAM